MRALLWRVGHALLRISARGLQHTDAPCEACRALRIGPFAPGHRP